MAQLRQDYHLYAEQETEVLVVGPEGPGMFRAFWEEKSLPFVGLPDPSHSVLRLFGQEVSLFKLGRMPAQVLVDQNGMARYVHYGKSMSDIPDNQEIMEILMNLNQEYELELG